MTATPYQTTTLYLLCLILLIVSLGARFFPTKPLAPQRVERRAEDSTARSKFTGPDLVIHKGDSGALAEAGDELQYTLIYNNVGNTIATNVVITETVPVYTTFYPEDNTYNWNCQPNGQANNICTLNIDELTTSRGGYAFFTVRVDETFPATTPITNHVTIGDDGSHGPDINPNNNDDTETTPTEEVSVVSLYLPLIVRNVTDSPDLIVETLVAHSNNVEVTIKNQGNAPVIDAFWVDVYIAPQTAPTGVNQRWQDLGSQGLTWGVTDLPLDADERLVLTLDSAAFRSELSNFVTPLSQGIAIYAQVDSLDFSTTYGAVPENHEIIGGAYNNVIASVSSP